MHRQWLEELQLINYIYQLVSPKVFSVVYSDITIKDNVIIRPEYLSICHADQRYYLGQRDSKTLSKKLPMALIHECCGVVACDPTNTFKKGQRVVVIPNVQTEVDDVIFENYNKNSYFLSSGHDGFMREFVDLSPDRVVPFDNIKPQIAAISEFVSVGMHSTNRFDLCAHNHRDTIGIWGDGSLAYTMACILTKKFPKSKIIVIGKDKRKLALFSFVSKVYLADDLADGFFVDHAFECAGGEGSFFAIEDIIKYINPQGTVVLMGVSENKVPINTRMVLEKGLTFVGCSRSGRKDFENAVSFMEDQTFQKRLSVIIYEDDPVSNISDIQRVFATDLNTPFKTVFKWNM